MKARFPRTVFGSGQEPDARFSLANERTFLAWNRTALALIAGGVALEALGLDLQPGFRLAASMLLIVCGSLIPITAWAEWMHTERALRLAQHLPGAHLGAMLAVVITLVGGLVACGVLLR